MMTTLSIAVMTRPRFQLLPRQYFSAALSSRATMPGDLPSKSMSMISFSRFTIVRLGIQPGELPPAAGPAAVGEALVADNASGEAHQDRGKGRHTCPVLDLPDGRGRRATVDLPSHPRTHSAAQATGAGANMTVAPDEMAGGSGGDGDGLPTSVPSARMKAVSGTILVRRQANAPLPSRKRACGMSANMIESSKRPTVVMGASSSGKFRFSGPPLSCRPIILRNQRFPLQPKGKKGTIS